MNCLFSQTYVPTLYLKSLVMSDGCPLCMSGLPH
jgi:hypothetical protein